MRAAISLAQLLRSAVKLESLAEKKAVLFLGRIFSSKYLPIVSAVVVLACYYLGWDLVSIWYFCLCGIGIMITCRDVTPIFSVFLLMSVMVSAQHSPSLLVENPSDYFTRFEVLIQMVIAITLLIGTVVMRIIESIKYHRFKLNPIFFGFFAFVTALIFNGIFSEYHTIMDVVYALFLAVVFLGIFCFANGNIQVNGETFERIAFSFIALLAVLIIELFVAYLTYDGLFVDGTIYRWRLQFGWGMYNTMGMMLTMCIPACFYLASKYKHGWAFTLCGVANLGAAYLCTSRQAILMGTILFVVCAVWLLIRTHGKARLINALIMFYLAVIGVIVLVIMYDKFASLFSSFMDNLDTGSDRTIIWQEAINKFLSYPIFGAGFYSRVRWVWGQSGFADMLPRMYHNTLIQILECSGLVGFTAYAYHRVQTVLSFFKNVTNDRLFIALTIVALLLVSLLDNHIFYIFPTIIYSMLVGVLALSEKKVGAESKAVNKQSKLAIPAV